MKRNWIFLVLILPLIVTSLNAQTVVPDAKNLADDIVGIYEGKMQNKDFLDEKYRVKVTKVSGNVIKIEPVEGNDAHPVVIQLTKVMMGDLETIQFRVKDNLMENNGTFIGGSNQLLNYGFHLGGDDDGNVEVFLGRRVKEEK